MTKSWNGEEALRTKIYSFAALHSPDPCSRMCRERDADFVLGASEIHVSYFPKNFPIPTRTSTVLMPGFGELNPAFEICR
jgi:hypothetical protein